MTAVFNSTSTREKRRALRQTQPETEANLWQRLRGRQVLNHKFRRQYSVGEYILDFYCSALKLAIEVDGSSHDGEDAEEYDHIRQRTIEAFGIHFIRFKNAQVRSNPAVVIQSLAERIALMDAGRPHPPSPSPSQGEGQARG